MRILYISSYLANFGNAIGETSRQLVRELRKAGVDVETFPVSDYTAQKHGRVSVKRGFFRYVRQIGTRWLPNSVVMFLLEGVLLTRAVRRSIGWSFRIWWRRKRLRPDVLLARGLEYDWTPWIAAKLLDCPLVLETHSANYIERELRGHRSSSFVRWLDRVLWTRADRLWVVSNNLGKIVVDNGVDPARVKPISLGVNKEQFDSRGPARSTSVVKIIFVGSFHPWHGVATLLDAFALALRSGIVAKLILIGDGVTRAENQREAEVLGISQHVEFTGWLPLEEISKHLGTADIAVAPFSKLKSFHFCPVKILEYMATGLPVIASEEGEVSTMLDGGRCGILVPPGEIEPLANEIVRLAGDSDLRRDLGTAAQQRVEEHYDWSVTIQQVIELCRAAINAS